jgi:adenylate cyclase
VFVRNYDKAIDQANRSIRLSPLDPLRYQPELALALAYFLTDRFLAAADAARQAVQSSPSFNVPLLVLAASYVRLGRLADARAEVRRALEVHPNFTIAALTMVGFDADQRQALAAALREAGMPE